jgi:hypothetical protein
MHHFAIGSVNLDVLAHVGKDVVVSEGDQDELAKVAVCREVLPDRQLFPLDTTAGTDRV